MAVYSVVLTLITVNLFRTSESQTANFGNLDGDSVFFSTSDVTAARAFIQYSKATPDPEDFENEFYNLTTLRRSPLDARDEYWGLAASYDGKRIFWNSYSKGELYEFDVPGWKIRRLSNFATGGLESIAYDHVTSVLYWTDSRLNVIISMETEDGHFLPIYENKDIPPHALAVHTTKRKMFFSEHLLELVALTRSKILKCDLDGDNVETILKFPDVIYVLAITIDYGEDKIYWTDRGLGGNVIVAASDLDGKQRRQFFSSSTEGIFTGIAYHDGLFYVVDALNRTTSYYKVHVRYRNTRRGKILKTKLRPRNVAIYAPNEASGERVRNECERSRCDHLCLASFNGGRTCKCTEGYTLVGSYRCQTEPLEDEFLLVSDIGQTGLFQLPLLEQASEVQEIRAFPFKERPSDATAGMTLDPSSGELVWYNPFKKIITWGRDKLAIDELVLSMQIHPCLRRLFWVTSTEMYSWAPGEDSPKLIRSLPFFANKEMAKIALDFKRNHIYWTENDQLTKVGSVHRIHINGTGEEPILENIPAVQGIAIYYETYTLYVMSLSEGMLFMVPLKLIEEVPSTNPNHFSYSRTNLSYIEELRNIQDIVVVNGKVYFADPAESIIKRFTLALGPESMENFGPGRFFFPIEMSYYSRAEYEKTVEISPGCRPVTTAAATTMEVTTAAAAIEHDTKPATSHPCDGLLKLNFGEDTRILTAYFMCRLMLNPDGAGQGQQLLSLLGN